MNVPKEFQSPIKAEYPRHNKVIFEQWLIDNIGAYQGDREYLPVNWCGYYVNNRHGNDSRAIARLQKYINSLPSRKYWTVTQYDDGILNDISRLDIKVFGSGGGRIDFPLPLVCHPHGRQENERDIFCNFVGLLTHQIRRDMMRSVPKSYYVSNDTHDIDKFCNILSRSVFTLCPRGYGPTSFRICEALEQGSVPIYVSDRFINPFNLDFNSYGVQIRPSEIILIDDILRSITDEELQSKVKQGRFVYEKYYTFRGLRQELIGML
jgi:hypothetical protein